MKMINKIITNVAFIVILVLLLIIHFKNGKIERLENAKPVVEYVYDRTIETVEIPIEQDAELIVTPSKVLIDSVEVLNPQTHKDTLTILPKLQTSYVDWVSKRYYNGIAKDDSSMFVSYNLSIQYNKLDSLSFKFQNRYPYERIQKIEVNPIRILGGVGVYNNDLNLQLGYQGRKGIIYEVNYSIDSRVYGFGIKTTLFKIK